ncbi:Stp1/IreP family PP2C-type Ser/Thr phosphatase [Weissella thailandensis]|uniref:Stp1/IreP family PP2C-type Ser/Thr phosphatase n=1 Tax=Weissella thailandensis TaxID=89061 RepID=A0ABX9I3M5_9LACO|nr:Stp1/IreP family PP2C-type Ser/Thr phosphatase [Weissella thailandensis]NKY91150.1 Stp1/IreP family PP2C-type Ser/Thr phosphatase [Weissella thailandensis]RDS59283.1 Stp1/IreP family PP2C-type Ser/Thr phosphatase [Weissella thailandensis]GEP74573.1 serine/threonine protein phosphatase [Weissella thailandensis]
MKIAYASDTGRMRAENQDYVSVFINQSGAQLAIVADGVGGQNGGDVAATMAVSHIGNQWQQSTIDTVETAKQWLIEQVNSENDTIVKTAQRYRTLNGMATTLVIAVILANQLIIANIGDSRAYVIRQRQMRQLTVDHNLANELLQEGAITEDEAVTHPGRHLITRQLGVTDDSKPDLFAINLYPNDYVLMTTDGMPKHVSDENILQTVLSANDIADAVTQLITKTNNAGGSDNVTVLIGHQESEDY